MRIAIVLLACCLGWAPSHAGSPVDATGARQLLHSARYWSDQHRPDLARQLMRKLLAIQPNHPEALRALGLSASAPKTLDTPVPKAVRKRQPQRRAHARKRVRSPVAPTPRRTQVRTEVRSDMPVETVVDLEPFPAVQMDASDRTGTPSGAIAAGQTGIDTFHETWKGNPAVAYPSSDDRRQPQIALGSTFVHKPGDAAVSRLDSRVTSLQLRLPQGTRGHWYGQIDTFALDAGRAGTTELVKNGDWGTAALRGTADMGNAVTHARAQGTSLAVGYDADHWRADIGVTPIGFEFSGISAGVDARGEAGAVQWNASLAHRPVTGGLLSQAGQRDAFSGIRWGAVRRTSARLEVSTSWRGLEPFAQVEVAAYRGHEVLPNRERAAAVGVDWVLRRDAGFHLALGPVLRFQSFDNNQNHHSVGHGGYYSPQGNASVSLPVQAAIRHEDLSWLLRLAPSWSQSSTAAAARFPTRADLQAQAVALGVASYGASRGPGKGWALQSTWEYRLNAHWSTGLRVAAERSTDYAKDQIHAYLRWHEKPQHGPAALWPTVVPPHAGI